MKATNIHARFFHLALGTVTLAASVTTVARAQVAQAPTNAAPAAPATVEQPAPAQPSAAAAPVPAAVQPADQKPETAPLVSNTVQAPAELPATNIAIATT